jgi:hypothetical protein
MAHSPQEHNADPSAKHETCNAIQCDAENSNLGEQTDETLNYGMTYMAVSSAITSGVLGRVILIPQKFMNSALYFWAGVFPVMMFI